ncbi:hypothetical protein TrRE_jg506 [Triparma retinervis]|uniref:Uncharacterized protein n=1 Tax=Triparma retinervis TaxID=2557542 RepID=A0A9W7AGZ7_9STRA|nr:hypothetical protein TrRE_jg506 [Triparma retinervis]
MVVPRSVNDGLTCGKKFWTTTPTGGEDDSEVAFKSKDGTRSVIATVTETQKGEGRWARGSDADFGGTKFEANLDLSGLEGKSFAIIVRAKVDSSWGTEKSDTGAVFDGSDVPESHLVNARTNLEWRKENAGKVVEGRTEWFSGIINVQWGDEEGKGVRDAGVVGTRVQFEEGILEGGGEGEGKEDKDGGGGGKSYDDASVITDVGASSFDIVLMAFGVMALVGVIYLIKKNRGYKGRRGGSEVEIEGFEMNQRHADTV